MAKKINVIGSGFGGLAAALRLKAKGHKVTLVEKHPDLGGRARVFKKDQFIYDGGPTVITAPYLFEELFSLFNKNISDYVEIVPLDLWYRFIFSDGKTFDYCSTVEKTNIENAKFLLDEKSIKIMIDKGMDNNSKMLENLYNIADKRINEIKSEPRILRSINSEVSLQTIMSVGLFETDVFQFEEGKKDLKDKSQDYRSHFHDHASHSHDHGSHSHDHGSHSHDDGSINNIEGFTSISYKSSKPFSLRKFQYFLDNQISKNVFRAKGILWFIESERKHI